MSALNREAYLLKVLEWIREWQKGHTDFTDQPVVRVSVGLPTRGAFGAKRVIGQVFSAVCSADGTFEIFVSPTIDEPFLAIGTLIHEYCHTLAGIEAGHRAAFGKVARAFGLEGKLTATYLGEEMRVALEPLVEQLGPYPHAALTGQMTDGKKKQGTRMVKCECGDCGYTLRTTRTWLAMGVPECPCCKIKMMVDGQEPGEGPEGEEDGDE